MGVFSFTFRMRHPPHIQRDDYHVLDWRDDPNLSVDDLWKHYPELVVGHYLVNTPPAPSGSMTTRIRTSTGSAAGPRLRRAAV